MRRRDLENPTLKPVNCEEIFLHLCHFMVPQFLIIIIIFINCKWVDTRWQWLFYVFYVVLLDSCTMGTGSFPGVKRPGRGDRHSPSFISEFANGFELYLRLYPVLAHAYYVVTCASPVTGFYWGFC
jgi:hypothetical protein